MSWQVPSWYELVLLTLATFRVWRLLAEDAILDRSRGWFVRKSGEHGETWLLCPWCAGAWIVVVVWLAWVVWPQWTLIVAVPAALSALVALAAVNLDRG